MLQKIANNLFGPASVSAKVNRFYELYKATLVFSLMMVPYMLVNLIFKVHPVTMPIYLIVGVWLYPNVMALLKVFTVVYGEDTTLKLGAYFRLYWQQLRRFLKPALVTGAAANLIIGGYLYEVALILTHKQLAFMIVPFIVIGTLATAALLQYIMISVKAPTLAWRSRLKLAIFMGWKYLGKSTIMAFLFVAWLSFANQAAFMNVLIVSMVIWWLLYRQLDGGLTKLAKQLDKE